MNTWVELACVWKRLGRAARIAVLVGAVVAGGAIGLLIVAWSAVLGGEEPEPVDTQVSGDASTARLAIVR